MWNSQFCLFHYRSLFLLVRVRVAGFRLTLPLALFLMDETIEIIADMLWLTEKFIPGWVYEEYFGFSEKQDQQQLKRPLKYFGYPHQLLQFSREFLNELRRHGRYSLVEVEVGAGSHKQRVSVELL
jgi:hypothetical protein